MKITAKDLTLEEKIELVKGAGFFRMSGVESKGLEGIFCLDGGTGLNFEQLFGDFCSSDEEMHKYFGSKTLQNVISHYYDSALTDEEECMLRDWIAKRLQEQCKQEAFAPGCFPAGIVMGSTWNPEIVYEVASALGKEAAAYGVDLLLGTPYVNMMRDPLNGRLFEGYGEDPYLMTRLAPQMVKGVQNRGVAANVKHFAANNQESFRVGIDEMITKRALYEIYLPAFKACVEAKAATVMSAYNRINGVPCTENEWLLNELLRNTWGFDGMVVSDWGAVKNLDLAIAGGNDVAMPGPVDGSALVSAIENKTLPEEKLDIAVNHVLSFMEECRKNKKQNTEADLQESDIAAYRAAVEGIVLLKNENEVFPLTGDVALFGNGAKQFFDCGNGSARIITNRGTRLVDELQQIKGKEHVSFGKITEETETVLIVVQKQGMEGNDYTDMFLPGSEEQMLLETIARAKEKGKKIGVILNVYGPVDCTSFVDLVDGIFCVFLPGMQGAKALADLLVAKETPSGRLTVTFPKRYEDTPTCLNFPGDGYHTIYGEDIFVGYRYYDTKKIKTLYPFGHGLSYTTFVYGKLCVDSEAFTDKIICSVDVTNTGNYPGKEVVMLFVSDIKSTLRKPSKELKGFEKIYLTPEETKTVRFTVTKDMLASYDMDLDRWEAEEGYYDLMIARSAEEVMCSKTVYGAWQSAYTYSRNTSVKVSHGVTEIWELLYTLFEKYRLDIGCLEDVYQYTPHTKVEDVIHRACKKHPEHTAEMAEHILVELEAGLKVICKK